MLFRVFFYSPSPLVRRLRLAGIIFCIRLIGFFPFSVPVQPDDDDGGGGGFGPENESTCRNERMFVFI